MFELSQELPQSLWVQRLTPHLDAIYLIRRGSCHFHVSQVDLDMESPIAKMIAFLKKYNAAPQIGKFVKGPSKSEAEMLLALIIRRSDALAAPDINQQLKDSPQLDNDMARCVVLA